MPVPSVNFLYVKCFFKCVVYGATCFGLAAVIFYYLVLPIFSKGPATWNRPAAETEIIYSQAGRVVSKRQATSTNIDTYNFKNTIGAGFFVFSMGLTCLGIIWFAIKIIYDEMEEVHKRNTSELHRTTPHISDNYDYSLFDYSFSKGKPESKAVVQESKFDYSLFKGKPESKVAVQESNKKSQ